MMERRGFLKGLLAAFVAAPVAVPAAAETLRVKLPPAKWSEFDVVEFYHGVPIRQVEHLKVMRNRLLDHIIYRPAVMHEDGGLTRLDAPDYLFETLRDLTDEISALEADSPSSG